MNLQSIYTRILALPRLYSIGGAVVAVAIIVIGVHVFTTAAPTSETPAGITYVTTASVATLSSPAGPLPVTGKATSLSQATILAQTSGEITALNHAIGDRVAAGAVIAAFENSSQQAAVLQAQGAYDAAQAAYQKTTTITAASSQTNALAALASSYASLDDAVHAKADIMFTNSRSSQAQIVLTVPDSALVAKVQNERVALENTLSQMMLLAQGQNSAAVDAGLSAMLNTATQTEIFLTDLAQAVSETTQSQNASATTLAADQSAISAARTETATAIAGLTSAKSAYDSSANATGAASSGSASDVASAAASVKQAQGALDAAKATLEKTLVRSPISGTIVSLAITRGDFVSSFSQVAIVSNPGALYIDAQVTPSDAQTLAVGNAASIEDGVNGVITFIAPALDPTTNKIEVKVGIPGDQSTLTDGEVVTLSLNRSGKTSATAKNNTAITIPIVAAKITPTGPVVFTVSTSSILEAHPITLGTILGDQITVVTGLTPDMVIVTDARGLAEGQAVVVNSP